MSFDIFHSDFLGLGLGDEKDITIRAFEAIKSCEDIYLEAYTSVLGVGKDRLVSFSVFEASDINSHRKLFMERKSLKPTEKW